jgi:inner membrane protein
MDTITHGIVGALAGRALFAGRDVPAVSADAAALCSESDPVARAAITACTLGAMFPDIDVFAGPIAHNPLAIIEWHRNITHSLVMLPIWALLLAGVSLPLARRLGWKPPSY